jgi:hypothetical protein
LKGIMTSALSLLPAEHRGVLDSVVRFFPGHPGAVGG